MKQIILISAGVIFLLLISLVFFLDSRTLEALRNTFTIISGTASFITVIIAILLYNKYGIEKTIKEKNLEISLKLLEEIKNILILFRMKNFVCNYRPATWSMVYYEPLYKSKLLFPDTYYNDLMSITKFSNNLYLPREIKQKLDEIIPYEMESQDYPLNESEYLKVYVIGTKGTEWNFNTINKQKDITLQNYLIKWDELIMRIKDWCESNSASKIDLNIN